MSGKNTKEKILANAEALVLRQGFVGTSIEDILHATGITKGAFFYHFKSKAELAQALVERYWLNDSQLFAKLSQRADELSSDPLQSMLIFLKLFEEHVEAYPTIMEGCIFAAYVYENQLFDRSMKDYIANNFKEWGNFYAIRIENIITKYPPKIEVSVDELAEEIMCIIQGSFILAKSWHDPKVLIRTSKQFRNYLQLLFA